MGRRKKQSKDSSGIYGYLRTVLLSILAAAVVVTALTALFALAMSLVTIPSAVLSGAVIVLLILAGFVSGYLAAKSIRKKRPSCRRHMRRRAISPVVFACRRYF